MNMIKCILQTLITFFCLASLPSVELRAQDSLDLRVMTFNIRYGTADDGENRWALRKTIVFNLLREQSPDIIALQEALRFQIDEIRQALPSYNEVGVGRDDGRTAGEYAIILYREDRFRSVSQETFWFSSSPTVPGSASWGNTIPRICTWTRLEDKKWGKRFYVYNLHLDHISQLSREKSVVTLARMILARGHHDPFIITGDFNAGEQNPAIRFLKGEDSLDPAVSGRTHMKLVDTYRRLHPEDSTVGTYHAFRGNRNGEKIDYIFVESWATVRDAAIICRNSSNHYPSDHFPVTARIVFSAIHR
jgi:endonuclease/exonuclease/phosphatase family metal-dependent hydrolase